MSSKFWRNFDCEILLFKDNFNFCFRFNKDLSSLKCEERQKNKLIEIIRSALNEVSCEELPNGCDDLSVEIENNNLGNHEVSDERFLTIFLGI
jgi:hypothetical protein